MASTRINQAFSSFISYESPNLFNNCYYLGLLLSLKASCRFTCNISQNINSLCHLKFSTLITHSISWVHQLQQVLQVTALAQGTRTLYCKMFNNASIKCLLVWRVVNRMRQLCLKVTINSPWEIILGFNLMATRREKRQGMKLCSGIRTICDFSWLDQSHTWKCGKTQSGDRQPLTVISATHDKNQFPVHGNFINTGESCVWWGASHKQTLDTGNVNHLWWDSNSFQNNS